MMLDLPALFAAFLLGLFSSAHCLGMCGGIMGALGMAVPAEARARRGRILASYNLGRIASYSLMGLLVGLFAAQLAAWGALNWLRWLAGVMLIAMGLYLANWWRGLAHLETAGRYLWAYLQPIGKAVMPVDSAAKGFVLGAIWGWLPCGLVYSALVYAMAQGNSLGGGAIMLAFGLGTLPALLAAGLAAQQLGRWLQRPQVRGLVALVIIIFGVWTLWGGGHSHGSHESHGDHGGHPAVAHSATENHRGHAPALPDHAQHHSDAADHHDAASDAAASDTHGHIHNSAHEHEHIPSHSENEQGGDSAADVSGHHHH